MANYTLKSLAAKLLELAQTNGDAVVLIDDEFEGVTDVAVSEIRHPYSGEVLSYRIEADPDAMPPVIPVLNASYVGDFETDDGLAAEMAVCPSCHGLVGVDVSYLEQVSSTVLCPCCGLTISFGEED